MCIAAPAVAQDTITLRTRVHIAESRALTLGDVAELKGSEAERLGSLVLLGAAPRTGADATVSLGEVRARLESEKGVNLGRITLSGSNCSVRVTSPLAPQAPTTTKADAILPGQPPGETVKDRVAGKIADVLGVAPADLRLTFEDASELLSTPTTGRTVAVQHTGSGQRMPVSIRVYDGDRLIASGSARIGILVQREVVMSKSPRARGETASTDDLTTGTQWLPPDMAPARLADVRTADFRARVDAGQVIEQRHIEAPLIVKKGDLVTIDCLTDTIVVTSIARARQAGRDGDVIEFQTLQSKRTFKARMNGAGRAVLVATSGEGTP